MAWHNTDPSNGASVAADAPGGLPALVRHYLERALPAGGVLPGQIRITQTGEMWREPGARAMRFRAVQHFAVDRVGFRWEARFPIAPLIALKVTDGFADGNGLLRVQAFGLPLQRYAGHDVDVGEASRYLSELVWVPAAIAANPQLEWRAVDARRVEVATCVDGERVALALDFDASGAIVACSASARPRTVKGRSVPTPWGGEVTDYRVLGGIWMPTRAEVYWDLPEGRFVYWRGQITGAEALQEPFGP